MLRKILVSFAIAAIAFALGGAFEAAHAAKPYGRTDLIR